MRRNFVGRSDVSAISQTPASGPAVLVTTPPISSASTATRAAAGRAACCARRAIEPAKTDVAVTRTTPASVRMFMAYLGGSVWHGVGFHFDWSFSFLND